MRIQTEQAQERIAGMIKKTPCRRSAELCRLVDADIYLKLENLQNSGSFKLRGVANKLLSLSSTESKKLLIAASTGNHGAAFSYAVQELGFQGRIFLPLTASPAKLRAIEESGIDYELLGDDIVETEMYARAYAGENNCIFIPPYNDPEIVSGQGTVALELLDQLNSFDAVVVPVGGGGLISGIGSCLKDINPAVEIIGCQPVNSAVMFDSIKAGRILDSRSLPTLSDGTAGGIEPGSVTFDLCRKYVDDFVLLDEDEIAGALRFIYEYENMVIEGAAALSAAAVLKRRELFAGRRTVCLITGSRIDEELFRRILK